MDNSNARVAKNTIILYIRLALVMLVSLYTSRVVLKTLGVVDYGVYNVVGGIVSMLSFLNGTASSATSRYLTFALGRKDDELYNFRKIFSVAFYIHLFIALFVVIFGETVGMWYVLNKMVIPEERMIAALIVYQISLITCMVSFTQVPYNASIIAYEKMDIYAYIGIYEAVGKLVIAASLYIIGVDKLIVYSVLQILMVMSISIFYRLYCKKMFGNNCKLQTVKDKRLFKMLLSYSGWDLLGNFGSTARSQGTNLILNLFCGPVVNAARGITYSVENALNSFTNNFQTAIRPSIIKKYAAGEIKKMMNLLYFTCKFSNILYSLFAIPIFLETDIILKLWLGEPPEYTNIFIKIVLLTYFFSTVNSSIGIGIHATGDVKRLNIFAGSKIFIEMPLIYILLRTGFPPQSALIVLLCTSAAVMVVDLWVLKLNISEAKIGIFYKKVVVRLLITYLVPVTVAYLVHKIPVAHVVIKLGMVCIAYWVSLVPSVYVFCLNDDEKQMVTSFISTKLKSKKIQ